MNELDLNLSQCLVKKTNFTFTAVTNVCNGDVYQVPHGSMDYVEGGLIGFLLLALTAVLVVVIGMGISMRNY